MPTETAIALDFLSKRSTPELRELWDGAFGTPLTFRLQKDILICFLAYRLQETAYGGIRAATVKELNRHAQQFTISSRAALANTEVPHFKPGTRLLREWQGQTFEVTIMDSGYAYRGARYESLSKIAREITGARWSGPRFFGLKKGVPKTGLREPRHGR